MRNIGYLFLLLFCLTAFGQRVLVDDLPMCGHHTRHTYQALWDSLTSAGGTIEFTSDRGRFPSLSTYTMVILMHHNYCPDAGYTDEMIDNLIHYVCEGGNLLIMPIAFDDVTPLNRLLNDPDWTTGISFGARRGVVHSTNILDFPPYTDDIDYLHFAVTSEILVSYPAYPFAFDEAGSQIIAAISYPTSDIFLDCDCDYGGRIVAIADNHTFEAPVVGYIEPMDHRFIVNVLEAMSGIIELPPCDVPPSVPSLYVDTCLVPGEELTIYGAHLYEGITLSIGGIEVYPYGFASDSTSMIITCPDLPQSYNNVFVNTSGLSFNVGRLKVFCDWIEISSFGAGCFEIGDTVTLTGENFDPMNSYLYIMSPDGEDSIPLTDYEIISESSGWFVIPDEIDVESYQYQYINILNTALGNMDRSYILVPCPCPGQSAEFRVSQSTPKPADSRNPNINVEEIDSCYIFEYGVVGFEYITDIDSFMAVPGYWPDREPTNPISVEVSDDGGLSFYYIARNLPNISSFEWAPPSSGDYIFVFTAMDFYGNVGTDTIEVCVTNLDAPVLTGIIRPFVDCDPESILFTLRDSTIVDVSTIVIECDHVHYEFPESMHWLNDTTLVFYPDTPFDEGVEHWVRLSEMLRTTEGIRLVPDSVDGTSATFFVDYSGPEIEFVSPLGDTVLSYLPDSIFSFITDFSGVDSLSLWVSINDDTFFIADSNLSFIDSILVLGLLDFEAQINEYHICIGATDLDLPIECVNSNVSCFNIILIPPAEIEPISPDSSVISSCTDEQIKILFISDSLMDESTLRMNIGDETDIIISDPRLEIVADTIIFTPSSDWESCDLITVEVVSFSDIFGTPAEGLPVGFSFMVDAIAPEFSSYSPINRVFDPSPIVSVDISDECSGVDPSSIEITWNSTDTYTIDDAGVSFAFGNLQMDLAIEGITLEVNDTITICVQASDSAEYCGANSDSTCWRFWYYEMVCDLDVEISVAPGVICEGDSALLSSEVTGGYGDIVYNWEPAYGLDDPSSPAPTASPDTTIRYILYVSDDSLCFASDTVILTVNSLPYIDIHDTLICIDDSFYISLPDTFDTYEWSTGDVGNDFAVLADFDSNLFWITLSNSGCYYTDSFIVLTEECITPCSLEIAIPDTFICRGEAIELFADAAEYMGFISWEWSPSTYLDRTDINNPICTPDDDITYTIVAQHLFEDCADTTTVTVFVHEIPFLDLPDTAFCMDTTFTISAGDSFDTYLWNDGSTGSSITDFAVVDMWYWVEVSRAGCTYRDSFFVDALPCGLPCTLDVEVTYEDTICFGSPIELIASAGSFFDTLVVWNWSPDTWLSDTDIQNPVSTPESSITYLVTAFVREDCIDSEYVALTVLPSPEIDINDTVVCLDSTLLVDIGSSFDSYYWSNGDTEPSISFTVDSDSILIWVDVSLAECVTRDTFIVRGVDCSSPCSLEIDLIENTATCAGYELILSASAGEYNDVSSWQWIPSDDFVNPNLRNATCYPETSSIYEVIATFSLDCADTALIEVEVIPSPVINLEDTIVCRDSLFELVLPDTFFLYEWSDGSNENILLDNADFDSMLYWVEVINEFGCSTVESVVVFAEACEIPCSLNVAIEGDNVVCAGDSVYLTANAEEYNRFVYWRWSPAEILSNSSLQSVIAYPETTSVIRVIATHNPVCADTTYHTIEVNEMPYVSIPNITLCRDSSVVLFAGSGYDEYLWSTGETDSLITIIAEDSILYWVEVTNEGCSTIDSFMIMPVNCAPDCSLEVAASAEIREICESETTYLHAEPINANGDITYSWFPVEYVLEPHAANTAAFPEDSTYFIVTITDEDGCIASDSVFIAVSECAVETCFVHPKPFTPNSDGFNEFGKFEYPGMSRDAGIVYIYTLENELIRTLRNGDVERTDDGTILWDGLNETGYLMENGPYLYIIRVDNKTVCKGTVYIAR